MPLLQHHANRIFLFFQLFGLAWPAWLSTRGDPNSYDVKIMKEVLIHTQTCVCSNVNISTGLSNNYAWYLERLQEVGFINELKQSLAAFQRRALQPDVRQYRSILINIFLKRIVQLLPTWSIPFTDPFFQRLLQVSIKFYIERHVEANQPQPVHWQRDWVDCKAVLCCSSHSSFLCDPVEEWKHFQGNKTTRAHCKASSTLHPNWTLSTRQ
jgi:hypothetical protein